MSIIKNNSGVIALTSVIVLGLFLFTVGMLLVIQGGSSIFSSQFNAQADRAQFLAEAGIQDALIKVARNQGAVLSSYDLSETDGTTTISVAVRNTTTSLIVATSSVIQGAETVSRSIQATVIFTTATSGKILSVSKVNQ